MDSGTTLYSVLYSGNNLKSARIAPTRCTHRKGRKYTPVVYSCALNSAKVVLPQTAEQRTFIRYWIHYYSSMPSSSAWDPIKIRFCAYCNGRPAYELEAALVPWFPDLGIQQGRKDDHDVFCVSRAGRVT